VWWISLDAIFFHIKQKKVTNQPNVRISVKVKLHYWAEFLFLSFFFLPIHSVSTVPFYSGDDPIPSVIIERTERTK